MPKAVALFTLNIVHFPSDAIDSGAKQKQSLPPPPSPAFLEASELPARAAGRKKSTAFGCCLFGAGLLLVY